ncbi:MAG: hypothetical protein RMK52_07475 [Chitinophagales bacterium]|nr:hypothetical protein [Chitinophagales bacterium]MDW8394067.1 hypothetical protein [Chitinophagales bacterium]
MDLSRPLALLTDARYLQPQPGNAYVENIFLEDALLMASLQPMGYQVIRMHWDDPACNWGQMLAAVFRTTWDYFHRFNEFRSWLQRIRGQTRLINSGEVVEWNMNKNYLAELQHQGIAIPPTCFVAAGSEDTLEEIINKFGWEEVILKPAVSGAARHTYRFAAADAAWHEEVFRELLRKESLLVQQFQPSVLDRGEAALMFFDGRFSHAVLKRARPGDFRVQDDFGGTVHPYQPAAEEIELARQALQCSPQPPVYGRVDLLWDEAGRPLVSELELIEPELWLRCSEPAAALFANALYKALQSS